MVSSVTVLYSESAIHINNKTGQHIQCIYTKLIHPKSTQHKYINIFMYHRGGTDFDFESDPHANKHNNKKQ